MEALQPKISVIVPCYNYGHLITETLYNLQLQTYKNWECIIINDGSTDNTHEVVLAFIENDARFKYISQENKGISSARNLGIDNATGDYIQLLDADDLLEPEKFETQVNFLRTYKEIDIVYGDVKYFYSKSQSIYYKTVNAEQTEWMPRVSGKGQTIISALLKQNIMAINSPLFRKTILDKTGYFDTSLPLVEDWEFWLRCAINNLEFFYLDSKETAALVRMHSISMTRDTWNMRFNELQLKSRLQQLDFHESLRKLLAIEKANVTVSLLYIIAIDVKSGNFQKALKRYNLIKQSINLRKTIGQAVKKFKVKHFEG